MDDLSKWQTPQDVSLEDLDATAKEMISVWKEREPLDKKAKELYKKYEELEHRMITLLQAANKKEYQVDGVGRLTRISRLSLSMPHDTYQKQLLFKYISDKHGASALDEMLTINYQKLNSFFTSEKEEAKDPSFRLPGIPELTHSEYLKIKE